MCTDCIMDHGVLKQRLTLTTCKLGIDNVGCTCCIMGHRVLSLLVQTKQMQPTKQLNPELNAKH